MGIVIRRITLFVFGGMAHIEREPSRWRAELWMAAVGPVTSLALGFAFLLWAGAYIDVAEIDPQRPETLMRELPPLATLLFWLGQVNVLLGLFNLVPGFPLDGGRVLRAILWAATGSLRRATRWAATLGQLFAWLLIAAGILMMLGWRVPVFGAGGIGGLWLVFIGWFLYSAALMSYRQLLTRESLEGVPVSRVMLARFASASPGTSVQELVEELMLKSGQRAVPVLEDGRLAGIVCLEDIKRVPADKRATTSAADVMTPRSRLHTLAPQADAYEALTLMAQARLSQLPVVEGERLRGLVRREDLIGWLGLQETETTTEARASA